MPLSPQCIYVSIPFSYSTTRAIIRPIFLRAPQYWVFNSILLVCLLSHFSSVVHFTSKFHPPLPSCLINLSVSLSNHLRYCFSFVRNCCLLRSAVKHLLAIRPVIAAFQCLHRIYCGFSRSTCQKATGSCLCWNRNDSFGDIARCVKPISI